MFYGPPGVGKTTLVNGLADRVLFLSTDRGTRHLSAMRVEVNDWSSLGRVLTKLEQSRDDFPYDCVCVDHISDVCVWAEDYVCRKLGLEALGDADWGKGWSAYRKALLAVMHRLTSLPCGLVFVAHEIIREVEHRGLKMNKTMPRMTKTSWDVVIPMLDLVGYVGFRRVRKPGSTRSTEIRVVETEPKEDLYCKDRTTRQRPAKGYDVLPPDLSGGRKFAQTF